MIDRVPAGQVDIAYSMNSSSCLSRKFMDGSLSFSMICVGTICARHQEGRGENVRNSKQRVACIDRNPIGHGRALATVIYFSGHVRQTGRYIECVKPTTRPSVN